MNRTTTLGLSFGILGLVASALPLGCDRFASCEDTLSCDGGKGGGGAATGGAKSSGGSALGGGGSTSSGGTGSGGKADPCDACTGDTPLCNSSKECVACLENADCKDATKSVCDTATGTCDKCSNDDDCAHLSGKNVCDTSSGACVECTIATEAKKCGDNSCNPKTNACTGTVRGTLTKCKACVADSECETNYRCAPMKFQGADRAGGYCLKTTVSSGGCSRPYTVATNARKSLSGAAAQQYCGINEDATTCEAVLDLGADKGCSTDDDCGSMGLADGRCETVSFVSNKCTYSCVADNGCPVTFACGTVTGQEYCGGPTM